MTKKPQVDDEYLDESEAVPDEDLSTLELDDVDFELIYGRDDLGFKDVFDAPSDPDKVLEIQKVEVVYVNKYKLTEKHNRLAVTFQNFTKAWVLNATNARRLYGLLGKPKSWVGKSVTVYATETEVGGQTRNAIRVGLTLPNGRPKRRRKRA